MNTGKTVLVSGGSRGIARAIVMEMLEKGFDVAFTYCKQTEKADELVREAKSQGRRAFAFEMDIKNQQSIKPTLDAIYDKLGHIDVLVNNVGITCDKSLVLMQDKEWDDVIKVNLYGTFYLTRYCILHMLKKKAGRIVNISSVSGITGIKGQVNYSSSKAALIGFTRSLAKEVAAYGISVNCVAPAGVSTEMISKMKDSDVDALINMSPMKRLCTPHEVAQLVSYLADSSHCPPFLTGTVIPLDGGMGL